MVPLDPGRRRCRARFPNSSRSQVTTKAIEEAVGGLQEDSTAASGRRNPRSPSVQTPTDATENNSSLRYAGYVATRRSPRPSSWRRASLSRSLASGAGPLDASLAGAVAGACAGLCFIPPMAT